MADKAIQIEKSRKKREERKGKQPKVNMEEIEAGQFDSDSGGEDEMDVDTNGHVNGFDGEESEEETEEQVEDEEEGDDEDEDEQQPHSSSQPENKEVYMFDSDEDEEIEEEASEESEDSDDSEEDSEAEWEEAEKELDGEEGEAAEEAESEMDSDLEEEVPSLKAVREELETCPNVKVSQDRIATIREILEDFRNRRGKNKKGDLRKREEYVEILKYDLCMVYTYNYFLMDKFMDLFSVKEIVEYLEANENERPVTLRSNPLKVSRKDLRASLNARGVGVQGVEWSKVGLISLGVPSNVSLGATPEYMAGQYMMQGASSWLPVMALAPKPNETVLDLCAAPGGKSSHIASVMKNTGALYCNDVHPQRVKALVANLHRLGVSNSIVSCMDGRKLGKKLRHSVDRVLLDAPCTGTGIVSKERSVKTSKSADDVQRCSHLQAELLVAAVDAINARSETGGYVVYSTCSVLVEENEQVVNKVLQKRDVKIVPTGLNIGVKGFKAYKKKRFHPSLEMMKRVYPHKNNMEGFCVVKLKVLSNHEKKKAATKEQQ